MKVFISIILTSHLVLTIVQSVSLPTEFKPCHKAEPNFLECLGDSIQSAVRSLSNGNAALKFNAPTPAVITHAQIGKGSGAVDVAQNYSDIKLYGVTEVDKVKVTKADVENFVLEFSVFHRNVSWISKYKASGKILLLPVYGEGDGTIAMFNTASTHKIKGEFFTKKDEKYAKCTSYELKMHPGKVTFNFENLFNGNKLLGDNMNQVLNDNWKDLFDDVGSGYENVIALLLQNYCNMVFNRIPYKEIFQ